MEITIPEKFARVLESSDYINNCLNHYWTNNNKTLVPLMENRFIGLRAEYENASKNPVIFNDYYSGGDLINKTGKFRSFLRLAAGYSMMFGTFIPSLLRFELFSEGAYDLKKNGTIGKKLTPDHIFGSTAIGIQTFTTYKNSGWDLDYMINEYIPQTLYQYMICRLLKGEHQKESKDDTNGVARGKHTIEEKTSLLHYKESNISLPLRVDKLGIY